MTDNADAFFNSNEDVPTPFAGVPEPENDLASTGSWADTEIYPASESPPMLASELGLDSVPKLSKPKTDKSKARSRPAKVAPQVQRADKKQSHYADRSMSDTWMVNPALRKMWNYLRKRGLTYRSFWTASGDVKSCTMCFTYQMEGMPLPCEWTSTTLANENNSREAWVGSIFCTVSLMMMKKNDGALPNVESTAAFPALPVRVKKPVRQAPAEKREETGVKRKWYLGVPEYQELVRMRNSEDSPVSKVFTRHDLKADPPVFQCGIELKNGDKEMYEVTEFPQSDVFKQLIAVAVKGSDVEKTV
jgi:hypothetical protein